MGWKKNKNFKDLRKGVFSDYQIKMTKIFPWILVLVLVLISLRGLLMSMVQLGHNWDASFPFLKDLFIRLPILSTYTWKELDLGSLQDILIVLLLTKFLISTKDEGFGGCGQ